MCLYDFWIRILRISRIYWRHSEYGAKEQNMLAIFRMCWQHLGYGSEMQNMLARFRIRTFGDA